MDANAAAEVRKRMANAEHALRTAGFTWRVAADDTAAPIDYTNGDDGGPDAAVPPNGRDDGGGQGDILAAPAGVPAASPAETAVERPPGRPNGKQAVAAYTRTSGDCAARVRPGQVGFPCLIPHPDGRTAIHVRNIRADGTLGRWSWHPTGSPGRNLYQPRPPNVADPSGNAPVILVEGETAAIVCDHLGYPSLASTSWQWPTAAPTDLLPAGRMIVLWPDPDDNGRHWTALAAQWIPTHRHVDAFVIPTYDLTDHGLRLDARDLWLWMNDHIAHPERAFHAFITRTAQPTQTTTTATAADDDDGLADPIPVPAAVTRPSRYNADDITQHLNRSGHTIGAVLTALGARPKRVRPDGSGQYHCYNTPAHAHGDRNPSLSVQPSGGYRCHACGVTGDHIGGYAQLMRQTRTQIWRTICQQLDETTTTTQPTQPIRPDTSPKPSSVLDDLTWIT